MLPLLFIDEGQHMQDHVSDSSFDNCVYSDAVTWGKV